MPKRLRSSAWADATARGVPYVPAGRPCAACGTDCHPTYAVRGVCLDCIEPGRGWPRRRQRAIAPVDARAERLPVPALKPDQVARLPDRQRAVYAALHSGMTIRAIARRDQVSPAAVSSVVEKLRRRAGCPTRGVDTGFGWSGFGRDGVR